MCNYLCQGGYVIVVVGPTANLKGPYFQPSLSVCLSVCVSVCLCLWPALLPFNVNRFWRNLVTRTLLWSSLAATIMVQIGHRGTARRFFENFKKFSKITELNFKILVHHFLCLCLLRTVKKIPLDSNKTDRADTCRTLPPSVCVSLTSSSTLQRYVVNWFLWNLVTRTIL